MGSARTAQVAPAGAATGEKSPPGLRLGDRGATERVSTRSEGVVLRRTLPPCFVTCPGPTPHPCGTGPSIRVSRLSSVSNSAKCSRTGLVPLTSRRAVHMGATGPKVPRLVQGHPAGTWPSRGSRPGSAWLSPACLLLSCCTPSTQRLRVRGGGGTQASGAQLPVLSRPPPHLTLLWVGWGSRRGRPGHSP